MEKVKLVHYTSADSFSGPCDKEYIFHDFWDLMKEAGILTGAWDMDIPFKVTIETMGNRWGQPLPDVTACESCGSVHLDEDWDMEDGRCLTCGEKRSA